MDGLLREMRAGNRALAPTLTSGRMSPGTRFQWWPIPMVVRTLGTNVEPHLSMTARHSGALLAKVEMGARPSEAWTVERIAGLTAALARRRIAEGTTPIHRWSRAAAGACMLIAARVTAVTAI